MLRALVLGCERPFLRREREKERIKPSFRRFAFLTTPVVYPCQLYRRLQIGMSNSSAGNTLDAKLAEQKTRLGDELRMARAAAVIKVVETKVKATLAELESNKAVNANNWIMIWMVSELGISKTDVDTPRPSVWSRLMDWCREQALMCEIDEWHHNCDRDEGCDSRCIPLRIKISW